VLSELSGGRSVSCRDQPKQNRQATGPGICLRCLAVNTSCKGSQLCADRLRVQAASDTAEPGSARVWDRLCPQVCCKQCAVHVEDATHCRGRMTPQTRAAECTRRVWKKCDRRYSRLCSKSLYRVHSNKVRVSTVAGCASRPGCAGITGLSTRVVRASVDGDRDESVFFTTGAGMCRPRQIGWVVSVSKAAGPRERELC
jgi:hypothetical protein